MLDTVNRLLYLYVISNGDDDMNWFPTLNDALAAEGLLEAWPLGVNLSYGETRGLSAGGRWISIYRDEQGRYERPIHYATKVPATYPKEYSL